MNVEATRCLSDSDDSNQTKNRTGPWSVDITPRGFSMSVTLEIALECEYNFRPITVNIVKKENIRKLDHSQYEKWPI